MTDYGQRLITSLIHGGETQGISQAECNLAKLTEANKISPEDCAAQIIHSRNQMRSIFKRKQWRRE